MDEGSHPGPGADCDTVLSCCREHARMGRDFHHCPECGTELLRCPNCGGAISAMGCCTDCLRLEVEVPTGMVLDEGAQLDLPVTITNHGTCAVQLASVTLRSGGNQARSPLGNQVAPPGRPTLSSVALAFPSPGRFGLHVLIEVGWRHAGRLGFAATLPSLLTVRSRRHGPLISASTEGTGNLVHVSGRAIDLLKDQLSGGEEQTRKTMLALEPVSCATLAEFGDARGVVSWRTSLTVPDMLVWEGDRVLRPEAWRGVVLGRNRPSDPPSPHGTHAALRFDERGDGARGRSLALSGCHWRFYPWCGSWWLEQLGQRASVLVATDGRQREVRAGDRVVVAEGTRIWASAAGGPRLGFLLKHTQVEGHEVRRSSLVLQGADGHG